MSLYDLPRSGALRGKRIPKAKMIRMASRIARLALPRSSGTFYQKLLQKQARLFPNFRVETMAQPLAMAKEFDPSFRPIPVNDSGRGFARSLSGAAPLPAAAPALDNQTPFSYVADFKSTWVDDREWSRTLPEMLGMGILTQNQIESLKINNVLGLFEMRGGTEETRLEMGYYMQRMIMEGYLRGVDLVKLLNEDAAAYGGKKIIYFGANNDWQGQGYNGGTWGWANNTRGLGAKYNSVMFEEAFWNRSTDLDKMRTFYHEFGHALLDAPDKYNDGVNDANPDPTDLMDNYWNFTEQWKTADYDTIIGRYFGETPLGSGKGKDHWEPVTNYTAGAGTFDQVQGGPATGGTTVGVDVNTTLNQFNIQPPQVTPWSGANFDFGGGGISSTPDDQPNTPVSGSLPNMNLHSFSAGLQDVMRKSAPMLSSMAGSILKTGG